MIDGDPAGVVLQRGLPFDEAMCARTRARVCVCVCVCVCVLVVLLLLLFDAMLPAKEEEEESKIMRVALHLSSTKETAHGQLVADISDGTSVAMWNQLLEFVQSASTTLGVQVLVPTAASESCAV